MCGGKPVVISEMYSPKILMRLGSDQSVVLCPMQETSCSKRSLACARAGQVRIVWWKDSGRVPHRVQVVSGASSNQEGWAAR